MNDQNKERENEEREKKKVMKSNKFFSKKYVLNVLCLLCFTFGFMFLTNVNVKAATGSDQVWQSGATANSITISWAPQAGALGYKVVYSPYSSSNPETEVTTTNTSITINGLNPNTKYNFSVSKSYMDDTYLYYDYIDSCFPSTLPTKITGLKVPYAYSSLKKAELEWERSEAASGYQIQLKCESKNIKTYTQNGSYANYVQLKGIATNKYYKVRVRGFVDLNGKKLYGAFSDWFYFAQQPDVKLKSTANGMDVSWNKIANATNYTVYVSTSNKKGTYKKVGTTKNNDLIAKKYGKSKLKKGKRYYFYVVANRKVDAKSYQSYSYYCWSKKY